MRHRLHIAMVALATLLASAPMMGNAQPPETPDEKLVSQIAKALTNDPQAQYELARMYEHGVGTPPDLKLAHFWYAKAAKQNFRPAVDKIANWDTEAQRQQEQELAERARKAEAARAARERAAQQQLEAEAAAKAARERAAQEAAAKAARDKAAQEAAAKAAKEQAAQDAAATKSKRQEAAAAPAPAAPPAKAEAPVAKTAPAAGADKKAGEDKTEFSANPCKGPSAKFLSTCQ